MTPGGGAAVRQLGLEELEALYKQRICADFPRGERRPLAALRRLHARGRYVCLVLEEAGRLAAYATFICDGAVDSVFLDYYAVEKSRRGSGVGSRFLALLRGHWANKSGILLECERPDAARDARERENRVRRIRFYRRAGAEVTPLRWRAFGVDYNILWLPVRLPACRVDVAADLTALYAFSLPPLLRRLCTKLQA